MHKLIDWVFGMIMGAVAAALLFMLFFGSGNAKTILFGGTSAMHSAGTFTADADSDTAYGRTVADWEGVWYWMCSAMEYPIAKYYYDYCYVPEVLGDYYVDDALGIDYTYENAEGIDNYNSTSNTKLNIKRVPTNLNTNEIVENSTVEYSTGWY